VVNDLSLALKKGAIGCLLGPSGCGKTTVLRCIAGFEPISAGEIALNGAVISNAGFVLPPEQRHIGMVFQDYALFPHLTVQANVGFGLHRMQKTERMARTQEILKTVGLADVGDKYPHQLSGGQQQRVALARALAPKPDLLLLDEPFSNLDVTLRGRLSLEVRDILKSQNATAILVTHDQDEAFAIADEIGVMHQGEIQQWDSGYNLYHRPANRFVANFIGQSVFLPGKILDPHHVEIELGILAGEIPHQCMPDCQLCCEGNPVDVLIRPDDIVHDDASPLQATVMQKAFRGADIMYTLRLPGGGTALSLVPSHHNHAIGGKIGIRLEADHVVAFGRSTP
jgi:iron(III) transport system ATP-binding protein